MKTFFLLPGLLALVSVAHAQYNPVENDPAKLEYKNISAVSKRLVNGYGAIQTYNSGVVDGSQFFYPSFTKGSVTTTNNETISGMYYFLFDKVRQELFIMNQDDKRQPPEMLIADKSEIRSFTISTDRDHVFVPARYYSPGNNTDFYELLKKNDSGYTALKFVKTSFLKADQEDLTNVRNGEMHDKFSDKTTYYISYKMGKLQEIVLKQKSIINAFPESKKQEIENYFRKHAQEEITELFLKNLVEAMNR